MDSDKQNVTCPGVYANSLAYQSPLSRGFSRKEYWSGLLCPPPPGNLPVPGIELMSLMSPALAAEFFTTELPRNPICQQSDV